MHRQPQRNVRHYSRPTFMIVASLIVLAVVDGSLESGHSPAYWWREGTASYSSVEVHWLQNIIHANGTTFKFLQWQRGVAAEKFCDSQWEAEVQL